MEEPKSNVIPFRKKSIDANVAPIIFSDYWGDTFPLKELLDAIDYKNEDKKN